MPDTSTDNFTSIRESIFSDDAMRELCTEDPSFTEHITGDILEFVNRTKKHIEKIGNPFEKEQALLDNFWQNDINSFEQSWEKTDPFIRETYEQQTLDTEFFYEEFQNSLSFQNEKRTINFQSIKEYFTEKWSNLLFQKKMKWEFAIIEEQRKNFFIALYRQIDRLKKLRGVLPYMDEPGQMWDMSRGRWQRVNFDILKKYALILQKDKSLQELADTLGRTRQEERESEEEIYTETVIKPVWKDEPTARSEFIGIHESDDISSILPAETVLFAGETTELLFYKKFTEKKLQTFEYQTKILSWEKEGFIYKRLKEKEAEKGPFIICVDTSCSMRGKPETVAKTLCLALLKIAGVDNRKCYLISFSKTIETLNITNLKDNFEKLIEFLSRGFYGGTEAAPAIHEALRMIETEDYKKADVIMVSDFVMADFDDPTKNKIIAARENRTKFHSLVICNPKTKNVNIIEEFDNNWVYDANNKDCVLQLVKDINGIQKTEINNPALKGRGMLFW